MVHDKRKKEIILIEVGVTSQDQLQRVETEKQHKYDLLAEEMGLMYKCPTRIIPYVLTWESIVTRHHHAHAEAIGPTSRIKAYIQYLALS